MNVVQLYCRGCGGRCGYGTSQAVVFCSAPCLDLRGVISRQESRDRWIAFLYDVTNMPTTTLAEAFDMERSEVTRVLRIRGIPLGTRGRRPN